MTYLLVHGYNAVLQAMAELKKRPRMPLTNLWRDRDIAAGAPGVVQALLTDIKAAYPR